MCRSADGAALDPGLIDLERRRWKRRTTKPHERLVPVSSTPCSAYTSGLSTSSSSTALQGVAPGRPSLEVCFPLRCFQRLSDPDTATQRCHWRDNWYTGRPSNPVLSYYGRDLSSLLRPQQIGTKLSHDVLNPARVPL